MSTTSPEPDAEQRASGRKEAVPRAWGMGGQSRGLRARRGMLAGGGWKLGRRQGCHLLSRDSGEKKAARRSVIVYHDRSYVRINTLTGLTYG